MPGLKLHNRNKDIYLFINPKDCSIEQILNSPNEIQTLSLDTSLTHFGCANDWKIVPIQIVLNLDVFKDLFLNEETITNVKLNYNNHKGCYRTNCFQINTPIVKLLSKELNNENNIQFLSSEIFDKEQQNYMNRSKSDFETRYNFPISFLSEKVQNYLKLKNNNNIKSKKNDNEFMNEKKPRLTPSHEIYERILHDPNADNEYFVIGYLDRFVGIKEVEFNKFITLENERFYNTSIPFHRIRHFKYKGNIVWDREARVDLMAGNAYLKY